MKNQTGLSAEIKIVPPWAWTLAGIAFVGSQGVFDYFVVQRADAPPLWAGVLLGLLMGIVVGCYFLLIGYVSGDAKRRGMSAVLWTIVAFIIPHGLGIILYFLLRHGLSSACPQCGNALKTGFNFCPSCSYKVSPSCPKCGRLVSANDVYCPYCGTSLETVSTTAPLQSPTPMPTGN